MASPQYEHFKFNVGDFVQPVSVALGFRKRHPFFSQDRGTPAMQVVERIYQEFLGGVQLYYRVRAYFGEAEGYAREVDTFNEIELLPYTPPAGDES